MVETVVGGGATENVIDMLLDDDPRAFAETIAVTATGLSIWLYAEPAPFVVAYLGVITGPAELVVNVTTAPLSGDPWNLTVALSVTGALRYCALVFEVNATLMELPVAENSGCAFAEKPPAYVTGCGDWQEEAEYVGENPQ